MLDLGGSNTSPRIPKMGARSFEELFPNECFAEQKLDILFSPAMCW